MSGLMSLAIERGTGGGWALRGEISMLLQLEDPRICLRMLSGHPQCGSFLFPMADVSLPLLRSLEPSTSLAQLNMHSGPSR